MGDRLFLSPIDLLDADIYAKWAEWMNNRAVSDHYGGRHNLVHIGSAQKMLEGMRGYQFAIVLLENDELIGFIDLHDIDQLYRNAYLGIVIGEDPYRNKGYGTEATRLILEYGFMTLNLHNIMLSVHADNLAAIACYQKAGFQKVGCRREAVFKEGKYIDKILMDILAPDFLKDRLQNNDD